MPKPRRSKTGTFTVTVSFNYDRKNMTLGRVDGWEANRFAANIELFVQYRKTHDHGFPIELESWIDSLSERHQSQLADIGLLVAAPEALSVGRLIELFLEDYMLRPPKEVSNSTKRTFKSSMKNRVSAKLKKLMVSDIEPENKAGRRNAKPVFTPEAKRALTTFGSWQRNRCVSSTWSKDNKRLKQVGKWAVDVGLCDYNPFSLLPSPGEINQEHNVDLPRETVLDVMDQCIDPDTRLVFALGRFAGLRTPKECRTIRPEHVDFEDRTLKILDCKKKEYRVMPLFDEVYDELVSHRSQVEWGRYIMSSRFLRSADANNWNLMKEAIERTEHKRWVDLRQNLRSSCVNELLEAGFEEWQVCSWLGHSVRTSRKHYQKQTNKQLRAAVEHMRNV